MSYGAGVVGKVFEILGTMPSWFWWGALGFMVLCLVVWIWNRVWLKMGPDEKPLFAFFTLVVVVVAAAVLFVWLIFRGQLTA